MMVALKQKTIIMKKMHLFLAVLLSVFTTVNAFAADVIELRGKITDSQTQMPLAGATIAIPDLRTSALTNQNGEFVFKNLPARGRFLVQISYVGYKTITQSIDLAHLGSLDFKLQASVIEGREVVITGS